MADNKTQSAETQGGAGKPAVGAQKLGLLMAEARKRRGLSAEDLIKQTKIPAHYIRMIENDDYALIADQLYLLPFLRRYAAFVGLDAAEVASRFVREVMRADLTGGRMAEPIAMPSEPGPAGRRTWVTVTIAALAIGSAAAIVYFTATARHHDEVAPSALAPVGSPAAVPSVQAAPSAAVQAAPASSSATSPPSSNPADTGQATDSGQPN